MKRLNLFGESEEIGDLKFDEWLNHSTKKWERASSTLESWGACIEILSDDTSYFSDGMRLFVCQDKDGTCTLFRNNK